MMKSFLRNSLLLLFVTSGFCQAGLTRYKIYSYHADPPFHLPQSKSDLNRTWVEKFNAWQQDIELELQHIERPTLNEIVRSGQPYIILWANPLWFRQHDPDLDASESLFWDADVWISRRNDPINYENALSLRGMNIGVRKGFYYKGVTELINSGEISATEALSDYDNYLRLKRSHIDIYVMSRSSLLYWLANGIKQKHIFISQAPHDAYTRHILVSKDVQHLLPLLNGFIQHMKQDEIWKKHLEFWGIDSLFNPFELDLEELQRLPIPASEKKSK